MFAVHTTLVAPLVFGLFLILAPSQTQRGVRYEVEVHNHSQVIIDRIYMSNTNETGWGEDRLGSGVLNPSYYFSIERVSPGVYDFLFIDEDERKCTRMGVKVTENREVEITDEWLAANCKRR